MCRHQDLVRHEIGWRIITVVPADHRDDPVRGSELPPSGRWPCIVDIEASSLGDDSYPIDIAWLEADGKVLSHLIRPSWSWTDWSPKSAAIHGINREDLRLQGMDPAPLCRMLTAAWDGRPVLSDAPAWDSQWLERLWHAGARGSMPWIVGDLDTWLDQHIRCRFADPHVRQQHMRAGQAIAKRVCPPLHRAAADVRYLARYCQEVFRP
jgi:hypothetical protein